MKSILALLCSLALPLSAFAQGQVVFANTSGTRFTTNSITGASGYIAGLNTYRIGLYTAPAGTVNESLFSLIAVATNASAAPFAGLFSYPQSPMMIAGNNGTPIAYQVRAWSLFAGSSYEAAIAYGGQEKPYGGKSAIGSVTPATGVTPPPSLFSSTAGVAEFPGQLTAGIILVPRLSDPFPEPSAWALAVVGAVICGAFLRQRR